MNFIKKDLKKFALTAKQADAELLTKINITDVNLHNDASAIDVYKIRYYSIYGRPTEHYRVINASYDEDNVSSSKFYSINNGNTYVYYPKNFNKVYDNFKITYKRDKDIKADIHFVSRKKTKVIVLTDDERKALYLTNVKKIPAISIESPTAWDINESAKNNFQLFIQKCLDDNTMIILWFDDYYDNYVKKNVASLTYYLLYKGVEFDRLRLYNDFDIGFTDNHQNFNITQLKYLLKPKSVLPKHPDIRHYIETIKDRAVGGRLTSKNHTEIAIAIVADLEAHGKRIQNIDSESFYYFHNSTKVLLNCDMASAKNKMIKEEFPDFLASKYNIYATSTKILSDIITIYKTKQPIFQTNSYDFIDSSARKTNSIAIQINANKYIAIKPSNKKIKKFKVFTNGDNGLLFNNPTIKKNQHVVNHKKVLKYLRKLRKKDKPQFIWKEVYDTTRVKDSEKLKLLLALNCYITPWLLGWNSSQFPIEVAIGASSIGKSSTFQLRKLINNGTTNLPALAGNMGDFSATITNNAGLTVFDNVELNANVIKPFSNELCRLTTEHNPTVSIRALYSINNKELQLPVNTCFGFTCVMSQFKASDFINRAIFAEYEQDRSKKGSTKFYNWVEFMLEKYGGREKWLAHHLDILERFFSLAETEWDYNKQSTYRLPNYQQSLETLCRIFKIDDSWVEAYLQDMVISNLLTYDYALQGLHAFCKKRYILNKDTFTYASLWAYCKNVETFSINAILKNSLKCDNYIKTQETTVYSACGIIRVKKKDRILYKIDMEKWDKVLNNVSL